VLTPVPSGLSSDRHYLRLMVVFVAVSSLSKRAVFEKFTKTANFIDNDY
jgi:hypothetical protein